MASFAVEVVRLDDVLPHPNADKLDLAVIGGYRAVVQKGLHQPGDLVVYVPEDAILPPDVIEEWGFTGKLAGRAKNRVKAIRLRGELSQGLVLPVAEVERTITRRVAVTPDYTVAALQRVYGTSGDPYDHTTTPATRLLTLGDVVTGELGIEKWEEPIPVEMAGKALPRPSWFPMYTDIENVKKFNRVLVEGEPVVMTEKIHGTNFAVGMHREDGEMLVASRRHVLAYDPHNLYWRAALKFDLDSQLRFMLHATGSDSVIIFGEVFGPGIQDLSYGVATNDIGFRAFDIMLDGQYAGWDIYVQLLGAEVEVGELMDDAFMEAQWSSDLPMAPVLYAGPFSEAVLAKYTSGQNTISGSHLREGVVIRPLKERRDPAMGRVILKSINPEYLLRSHGTERH